MAAVILAVLGYFLWSRFGAGQPEDVLSELQLVLEKRIMSPCTDF